MTVRRRIGRRRTGALPIVVDASIAVQWFANEPGADVAAQLLESDDALLAPDLMPAEAANAWWKKVRRREMSPTDLDEAVVNLLALGIEWVATERLLPRAAQLAVAVEQPVYDCLYLTLSTSRGARLATADDRLRRVAHRLPEPVRLWTP